MTHVGWGVPAVFAPFKMSGGAPRAANSTAWCLLNSLSPQIQRGELDALLIRQAAAAAERERLRLEREAQLQDIQLEFATQHMAACELGCLVAAKPRSTALPALAARQCIHG